MNSLPRVMLEPLVRMALLEDLGRAGDMTSDAVIPPDVIATCALASRQPGVLAGLDLAKLAFELIEPGIIFQSFKSDGSKIEQGDRIALISGPAKGILSAERVALNYLCHLSGIATATASMVSAIAGSGAKIVCTRKTTPGLRALEKYAVRAGGGSNHRFGLDDAMLIKDNHIAIAGGVTEALRRAKIAAGHLVKIEIEVDTLDQLQEALQAGTDAILLDNMTPETLKTAVLMVSGRAITEASGGITLASVPKVAASGVDLISVGWLTHSAAILDIGLDFAA